MKQHNKNTNKVLVTGGSGYFGSLLIEKLLAQGFECINIDLNPIDIKHTRLTTHICDVTDFSHLQKLVKDVDVVFHNVAQVPLAKNKQLFDIVNRLGTENVLKACVENGIRQFIYTSSSAIFGIPVQNPVYEDTLPIPCESYGKAKLDGENICHHYFQNYGIDVTIIRPRTILGHGRLGIFSILFDWIEKGKNVPVFDGGKNIYQFVHSSDLAKACLAAYGRSGFNVYNIGAEVYGTMYEALDSLCKFANTGSRVKSVPMKPAVLGMKFTSYLGLSPLGDYHALMYGRSMYFDVSKAKSELSWKASYSNEKMFHESYQWYIENKDIHSVDVKKSHHRDKVKQSILAMVGYLL